MIDADEFFAEAEAEEQHVLEMERDRCLEQKLTRAMGCRFKPLAQPCPKSGNLQGLNVLQRRVQSTTLLEEMSKITDYAEPSETVMLQAFNWESHQTGRGDWYGIVASKLQMFKEKPDKPELFFFGDC